MTQQYDISSSAMLASLSISKWEGHKLDKRATAEVTDSHSAASDAARVNKLLMPKEWFAPITTVVGAARTTFANYTLPWRDNGDRIMTSLAVMKVMDAMRGCEINFWDVVNAQMAVYAVAREQARVRLNTLYREEDYPELDQLRARYRFSFDILPVPTAGDFRAAMPGDLLAETKISITQKSNQLVIDAMGAVVADINEKLGHLHSKLDDPVAKFKASTITGLTALIDRLPLLNLTGDLNLENIRKELHQVVGPIKADDLREDAAYRKEKAKEVAAIMRQMKGMYGA